MSQVPRVSLGGTHGLTEVQIFLHHCSSVAQKKNNKVLKCSKILEHLHKPCLEDGQERDRSEDLAYFYETKGAADLTATTTDKLHCRASSSCCDKSARATSDLQPLDKPAIQTQL